MDKTTKALRARLRAILSDWLRSDVVLYREMRAEEESDALDPLRPRGARVPESALGRRLIALASTDPDGLARVFLTSLAENDEIGLIVSQIGERRPLKRTLSSLIGEEPSESWVVCRPGLSTPSLPQEIRSMTTLIDLMALAIIPEWIDRLDEDAPDLDGLTPDARVVLAAMRDLGAFCIEAKITQEQIRDKTAELDEEIAGPRMTQAIRLLKDRRYVEARSGTATWLTPQGQKAADMVKSPSNSE